MEHSSVGKNEILQRMAAMEVYPVQGEERDSITKGERLPFSKVAAYGTSFGAVVAAFQGVVDGGGQSGLYKVQVPKGGHLAAFQDKPGYLGTVLDNASNQVAGQATLTPLVCDPGLLIMAAALGSIDRQLESIQETQQEILDFLVQKEKAELQGNLNFLSDVLHNYKYNWDSEKYKNSNYVKVLDIKQSSEQKIQFCRKQILKKCNKKFFLHNDQDVKRQIRKIASEFDDYQLALYLYSFASFLEVMLLENFEEGFLDGVAGKMEGYALQYRELYSECYGQIESNSKSSIQSQLLKGVSNVSYAVGTAIEKIPIIGKLQIDEALIGAGERMDDFGGKRTDKTMQKLIDKRTSAVTPFVENIKAVNRLYNKPLEIAFDRENLYIETME